MNKRELIMLQSLPLNIKIAKSKLRIQEAINFFGVSGVYVPVRGGLDSTVLSHLIDQFQKENNIPKKDIPRVNSNTGLEYEGVLRKAREISDLEVKPLKTPYDLWSEIGYPVAGKKTSRMIRDIQNPTSSNFYSRRLYLEGLRKMVL